jgi:pyruvate/2-oxoglutarate dehydrogenase complex dihydrolipoamide acyltransferase (E2) component
LPNLELHQKKNPSAFRRIALGTWRTTYDPSVYGSMTVNIGESLKYIEEFRTATGERLTLSHLIAKAVAATLLKIPDANAIVRFNRIYLRERISVFFQVAMKDAKTGEIDLTGATVEDADKKSLKTICEEFNTRVATVRAGKDKDLEGTRSMFKRIPYYLLFPVLQFIGFLTYTLNLDLSRFGVPKDAFGSVMVTNIGSLGLESAFVPLVPYSRVALLFAVGAVKREPVVSNDKIVVADTLSLFVTFDHRILDGSHAAVMASTMREWLENPFDHFDPIPSSTSIS